MKRTRRLLQDSLRALLRDKALDDILVQEVTDAAEVNRATFYDHYGDKFDLFNALIGSDFKKFLDDRNVCFDGSCTSGVSAIVLAVGDFLEQVHRDHAACTRPASSGALIDSAVTLAIRDVVLAGLQKDGSRLTMPREVLAALVSGAIYNAVRQSLSEMNWRADEAALLGIVQAIHPVISQATLPAASGPRSPRKQLSRAPK